MSCGSPTERLMAAAMLVSRALRSSLYSYTFMVQIIMTGVVCLVFLMCYVPLIVLDAKLCDLL